MHLTKLPFWWMILVLISQVEAVTQLRNHEFSHSFSFSEGFHPIRWFPLPTHISRHAGITLQQAICLQHLLSVVTLLSMPGTFRESCPLPMCPPAVTFHPLLCIPHWVWAGCSPLLLPANSLGLLHKNMNSTEVRLPCSVGEASQSLQGLTSRTTAPPFMPICRSYGDFSNFPCDPSHPLPLALPWGVSEQVSLSMVSISSTTLSSHQLLSLCPIPRPLTPKCSSPLASSVQKCTKEKMDYPPQGVHLCGCLPNRHLWPHPGLPAFLSQKTSLQGVCGPVCTTPVLLVLLCPRMGGYV